MLEVFYSRRSHRKFKDKKIEEEKMEKILMAAQFSPSGKNTRPWEFIVVEDKETLKKLGDCRQPLQPFLPESPAAIVVLGDTQKTDTWIEDTSIAAAFMQLEAESLGIGTCWVQIRLRESCQDMSSEDYVRQLLNIPEHLGVLCILAIGYPLKTLPAHSRDEAKSERVHKEKY